MFQARVLEVLIVLLHRCSEGVQHTYTQHHVQYSNGNEVASLLLNLVGQSYTSIVNSHQTDRYLMPTEECWDQHI